MNVFLENRQALYPSLDNNTLLLLYSGARKQQSADEDYPFVVNMNFYYHKFKE